jgi:hypothetical protein
MYIKYGVTIIYEQTILREIKMAIAEKISRYVDELPEHLQEEALDFIEYLLMKAKSKSAQQEDESWSFLSLTSAMRGMEDEDSPSYTNADIKVVF